MPLLKQLTCHIEFSPKNIPLTEHGTTYRDGAVSTFVAVFDTSAPFSIHLTSHGYIAPGLAMFVFIDGVSQCNRNRRGLVIPDGVTGVGETEVDFRVRQKEERCGDGFVGREWTFAELDTVAADKAGEMGGRAVENIGTIEVVVLRCMDRPSPAAGSKKNVTRKVTIEETGANKGSDNGTFGGLAGIFDGANDAEEKQYTRRAPFGLDGAGDEWDRRSPINHNTPNQNPLEGLGQAFQKHGIRGYSPYEYDGYNNAAGANAQGQPPQGPQAWNYAIQHPYVFPPPWAYAPWPSQQQNMTMWPNAIAAGNNQMRKKKHSARAKSPASNQGNWNDNNWNNGGVDRAGDWNGDGNDDANGNMWGSPAKNSDAGKKSGAENNKWGSARDDGNGGDAEGWKDGSKDAQADNDDWGRNDNQDTRANRGWNDNAGDAWGSKEQDQTKTGAKDNTGWWKNQDQANANGKTDTNGNSGWANTNDAKKSKQAESKSSKNSISLKSRDAEPGDATVDPIPSYIKPYWGQWSRRGDTVSSATNPTSRRDPYILPAEPLHCVTEEFASRERIDFQVRAGKGKLYAHSTSTPRYIDSMRAPYAVFVFKYRSKEALADRFPDLKIKRDKIPLRERMKDMSREELLEYSLRMREKAGPDTDTTDSEESDSKLSKKSGKSKKSEKTGDQSRDNTWNGCGGGATKNGNGGNADAIWGNAAAEAGDGDW